MAAQSLSDRMLGMLVAIGEPASVARVAFALNRGRNNVEMARAKKAMSALFDLGLVAEVRPAIGRYAALYAPVGVR